MHSNKNSYSVSITNFITSASGYLNNIALKFWHKKPTEIAEFIDFLQLLIRNPDNQNVFKVSEISKCL